MNASFRLLTVLVHHCIHNWTAMTSTWQFLHRYNCQLLELSTRAITAGLFWISALAALSQIHSWFSTSCVVLSYYYIVCDMRCLCHCEISVKDSKLAWAALSFNTDRIVKRISKSIHTIIVSKYLYWYRQYFLCASIGMANTSTKYR